MLVFLTTLLAVLPSILRSRAALNFENLALRHQIGVLQRSAAKRPKINRRRPYVLDLSLSPLTRLALCACHPSSLPLRLSPLLDLESAGRPTWATGHFARGARSDPQDVPGESPLGCTSHPWRTIQTRHQYR